VRRRWRVPERVQEGALKIWTCGWEWSCRVSSLVIFAEVTGELLDFVGGGEAPEDSERVVVEAEVGREEDGGTLGDIPLRGGADVLRGGVEAEAVLGAESAVEFDAAGEIFRAEEAAAVAGFEFEGARGAEGVAEFPGLGAEVFFGDEIFREVEAFDVGAEDEFVFHLALDLFAGDGVGDGVIGDAGVAGDFEQAAIGEIVVFVLDVEDGIDPVLAGQDAEAIFPAEAGEDGGVVHGGLAAEVDLGGPPGAGAVFELDGGADEGIAVGRGAVGALVVDLEVVGLLHGVGVGDEVGRLLGVRRTEGSDGEEEREDGCKAKSSGHLEGRILTESDIRLNWSLIEY
jgi:hypothetical protein